jgi:hypothetical protein
VSFGSADRDAVGNAVARALPRAGGIALIVGAATYSMTVSVDACVVASAVVALLVLAIAATRAGWMIRDQRRTVDAGGRPLGLGWASKIFAAGAGLLGTFVVVTAVAATPTPWAKIVSLIFGLVLLVLAYLGATGRLATRVRRDQAAFESRRGLRGWMIATFCCGALLLLLGLADFSTVDGLRQHGATTSAVVTRVTQFKSNDTYFLRYILPGGRVITCSTEDVIGDVEAGQHIDVLYDSTDPGSCQSADYGTGYGEPISFTVAGAVLLLISIVLYLRVRIRSAG